MRGRIMKVLAKHYQVLMRIMQLTMIVIVIGHLVNTMTSMMMMQH